MSEFLGIGIKTLDNGGFHFCQTGLIHKVLEATGMEHCNGFPTPTKVDENLGKDDNGSEVKRNWPNSYASVIGMMLYLASNTRLYISSAVHQCYRFAPNTKASHEMALKRICWYLKGTKENGMVFNTSNKMLVGCYSDVYFAGLWGHENPQDHICDRIRTGSVATFYTCTLLWVSKLHTEIDLSRLHYEYVTLSHSVRALLSLRILIKEDIDNLGIDSEELKFVPISTV